MKSGIILYSTLAVIVCSNAMAVTATVTTEEYVNDLADTKQPNLTGTTGYAVTYGATAGVTDERQIVGSVGTSTSDTKLPTTGAVVTALNGKQNQINGNLNTVVTYTGSLGGTSSKGVYTSSSAYSGQTGNLAEAGHVNSAVTNAFNRHLSCRQFAPEPAPRTAANCLLWEINELSGTYMPEPQSNS